MQNGHGLETGSGSGGTMKVLGLFGIGTGGATNGPELLVSGPDGTTEALRLNCGAEEKMLLLLRECEKTGTESS